MNKKTTVAIVAAAAALLASAGMGLAQPPGITPEMIARALPLEGAPLASPGLTRSRQKLRSAPPAITCIARRRSTRFRRRTRCP
jgi:hypothetical protein